MEDRQPCMHVKFLDTGPKEDCKVLITAKFRLGYFPLANERQSANVRITVSSVEEMAYAFKKCPEMLCALDKSIATCDEIRREIMNELEGMMFPIKKEDPTTKYSTLGVGGKIFLVEAHKNQSGAIKLVIQKITLESCSQAISSPEEQYAEAKKFID